MVKQPVKKGTAYIVRDTEDNPGGDCDSPKCGVAKVLISTGMTLVQCNGKKYHASCAIQAGIKFKVPTVQKTKRVD